MPSGLYEALISTPALSVRRVLNEAARSVAEIENYINTMLMLFRVRGQKKIPIVVLINEFKKSGFSATPAQIKTMFAINNPLVSSVDDNYLYLTEIPSGVEDKGSDEEVAAVKPDDFSQDALKVEKMARNAARRRMR
jgi:hypothetical protein